MKPTIQHPRRPSRAILWSLVLVAFGLLAGNSARATTTYLYSGSHSLLWTTNSSKAILVTRTGGYDTLTVDAALTGSSNFTLNTASVSWPDSTTDSSYRYDTTLYFLVSFSSLNNDTSYATLILHDDTRSDTILLTGIGTFDSTDFTLAWTEKNFTYSNDSGTTNDSAREEVTNHRSTGISVFAILGDSTYWNIGGSGSTTITLSGNALSNVQITYKPHGVWHDSTEVYFICTSPYYEYRTVEVYVTDPDYAPQTYAPTVTGPNLGIVANDSTGCGIATIHNATSQAVTITEIQSGYTDGWAFSDLPSTPYSLAAGDSTMFTICFSPTNFLPGTTNADPIDVSYLDSNGQSGTATGYAYGSTPAAGPCVRALSDTIQLDEVISGGYVDAYASFVMLEDSTLIGGTGEVYPYGKSVQLLSPSLPMSVSTGDTVTFLFRVIPAGDSDGSFYNYQGYYPFYLGDCDAEIAFAGSVTDSTNTDLQLFQNETGLMALTSSGSSKIDTFWFDNNESDPVIVTNVQLSQGIHFSIVGELPHSLDDTLISGSSMGVIIQFNGDTNGFYHDSLTVTTEVSGTHGKEQITSFSTTHLFNLEAIQTQGSAGVSEPVANSSATISINPNPASGPVTIAVNEAQKATIEVFDILGNQIVNADPMGSSAYEWNASGMANGIYIVRASGVDVNGTPFVISERMVLNK